jgi:hypothetical protein
VLYVISLDGSTITLTPSNIIDILTVSGIPVLNLESDVTVIDGIDGTFGKYPFVLGNVGVVDISFFESLLKEQIIIILSNPIIKAVLGANSQTSIDFISDIRLTVSIKLYN